MNLPHRTEAWLTGTAAALCAFLATGSALNGQWFGLAVFAALAVILARISVREQHAARQARDDAVRAELLARPADAAPIPYRLIPDPMPGEDGRPICVCSIGTRCFIHAEEDDR